MSIATRAFHALEGIGIAFDALRPIDVWGLLQYFNLSSKASRD